MTTLVNRRTFLRGLGGACVAAPFLGSLADGGAARAQSPAAPKRLIAMFTHYGCITTRFFPKKSHGALTAADLEPTTLKHLIPYVDKLLLPRGIRAMNEWTTGLSRGQGNDPHTQVVGSFFTCQPVTPNSDDPFSFEATSKFNAKPVGPSLDHVMARQLTPGRDPLLISTAGQNDGPQSAISYSAAETLFKGKRASEIFSSLTGLFNGGTGMSPDSYAAIRGKSIIDLVRDDLDTLARRQMSQADKRKLEAWKALLDDTGRVLASAQCREETAVKLGLTLENLNLVRGGTGTDVLSTKIAGTLDGADLNSNVAVLAAMCNLSPIVFLKYPGNFLFQGLGLKNESGSLSGRLDNAGMSGPCLPGVMDMLLTIDDFYARKFAHLVAQLDSISEGDGRMLDNTTAIWFQEMSDGAAHNLNNLPIVQAGSAGGYFRTGWAVNVEDGSPTLSSGNSEGSCTDGTSATIDGINQTTGTDPRFANAPINKFYCSLMNALGVKGGPDGFPLAGGAAPVTHYGMYDRTEDFVGGGKNPPKIHSPGEFSALRAST